MHLAFCSAAITQKVNANQQNISMSESCIFCFPGEAYKQYGPNPDDCGVFHVSLILSADGASAFRTSSSTFWPCDGLIVELPPKLRCAFENAITFGFWVGRGQGKPMWNLFFSDIITELLYLKNVGFAVEINGQLL